MTSHNLVGLVKAAELSRQDKLSATGALAGSLLGGGIGYLSGDSEDKKKHIEGTRGRNALIGALLGAAGGGGLGTWYGDAETRTRGTMLPRAEKRLMDAGKYYTEKVVPLICALSNKTDNTMDELATAATLDNLKAALKPRIDAAKKEYNDLLHNGPAVSDVLNTMQDDIGM